MTTQMLDVATVDTEKPGVATYAVATVVLTGVSMLCWLITTRHAGVAADARGVIAPMTSLVALTGVVALAMVLVRNLTIVRGITSSRYYVAYTSHAPADWVERPARTFNNLLQLPVLFYVGCLAILITRECDRAQLLLAWLFVALRVVHSAIYIVWNHVPARFTAWVAGSIALAVLWWRFAAQSWPGLAL